MSSPTDGPVIPLVPDGRLPDGFAVRLDARVRRRDGGAALLGGSPLRLLRLAPRARALLTGDQRVIDTAGRVEKFRQRYGARTR